MHKTTRPCWRVDEAEVIDSGMGTYEWMPMHTNYSSPLARGSPSSAPTRVLFSPEMHFILKYVPSRSFPMEKF